MRTIDTKTAVMIVGGASWLKELLALLIKFRDALIEGFMDGWNS